MLFPPSGHFYDLHYSKSKFNRGSNFTPGSKAALPGCVGICALLVALVQGVAVAQTEETARRHLLQVPMHFEENQGQAAEPIEFLSRGPGYTLFLTPREAVLSLRAKKSSQAESHPKTKRVQKHEVRQAQLRMSLIGANPEPRGEGVEPLEGIANYFIGPDPAQWRTAIPTFGKVKYHDVYPGVDLVYYGNQQQLEYDFIVEPFADPKRIAFRLEGAQRVELEENGGLVIQVPGGEVRWHKPIGYQESSTGRTEVPTRFILRQGCEVSFEVADYDKARPLIIDPIVVYSTYLGGSATDFALGIAVHSSGSAYIVGDTTSLNFPTQTAYRTTSAGSNDVFVTKLNPSGSALVYSTYIGGGGDEFASGITLDAAGSAFITGFTDSANYPTRNAAYGGNAGFFDIFVTKLGVNGSNLVYSTYLGGAGDDFGRAVAVDNGGSAYVTGQTYSRGTGNGPFPTSNGAYQRNNGNGNTVGADAFVTKFNTNGAVVYSSFLGGRSEEKAHGIAVDSSGNAYVVGEVASFPIYPDPPSSDFPVVNPFQSQFNRGSTDPFAGTSDGFLTKINAAGSALVFSTFLGGFDNDTVTGIALDPAGRIGLAGITSSTNFPTLNAAQPQNGGFISSPEFPGPDAFVTQFQTNGTVLLYSTYLGGSFDEFPFLLDRFGIAADRFGLLYVAGQTGSSEDFPVTHGADQTNSLGSIDAFVAKINPAVSGPASLIYASYLSGSQGTFPGPPNTELGSIAVDNNGNFYVAGITSATNFPTTTGAFRTRSGGGFNDAFVAKFSSPPDLSLSLLAAPNPVILGSNVTYTFRIHNNGRSTFNDITNIIQFPTSVRFGPISNPGGTVRTNAGTVTLTTPALTNNASVTQTIVIAHLMPGQFTVTANVSAMSAVPEPNLSNNVASVIASVRGIADLAVAQSAAPSPTFVSSNLVYTLNVTNRGPSSATFVNLTNPLPSNLAFISAISTVGSCVINTNGVVCNLGTLPNGASAQVTITTLATASGTIINAPRVGAFEADFTPADNSPTLPTVITPLTEIAMSMTATNQVYAGNTIQFTMRVTNNGPSSATSLVLTNPFPAGAAFVSATASSGTTNLSSGGIGFNLGTLASNAVATVTLTLRALANTSAILNTGRVTNSAAVDPVGGNNSASASTMVIANADLALTQNVNPSLIFVSSNTTFTIALTNQGPSTATNVVLTSSLPAALSLISAQSTFGPCQVLNNTVTCNVGTLGAGMGGTATIAARATAFGVFANVANVTSSVIDLAGNNNLSSVAVNVADILNNPQLTITRVGTNVVLSWSINATAFGFVLQTKTSLATNIPWTTVTNVPVAIAGNSVVTNALAPSGTRFYRLSKMPQLLSVHQVGNSIVISWPAVGTTAVLRRTTNLTPSPTWTSAGSPTLIGGRYYVTNAISGTARNFYRLYN